MFRIKPKLCARLFFLYQPNERTNRKKFNAKKRFVSEAFWCAGFCDIFNKNIHIAFSLYIFTGWNFFFRVLFCHCNILPLCLHLSLTYACLWLYKYDYSIVHGHMPSIFFSHWVLNHFIDFFTTTTSSLQCNKQHQRSTLVDYIKSVFYFLSQKESKKK